MNQQWKPIESAPKDGTGILGYWNDGGLHDCNFRAVKFHREAWWETNEDYKVRQPTHWMPLPAAPGTPPASAQDDAKDELTRERIEGIAREVYKVERFTKDDEVWHNLHWLTSFAKAIEKELRRPAPAAGDALPNLPRGWQLALNLAIDAIENAAPAGQDWPVNWPAILHGLTALRAALAAQVPHEGDAA
ncbi:DUF551 domain-containing protein [Achromobacter mucicolens]|uniref:DUF551 domain-containing protein n=1 Tax=Achromobacter mucicolens TaxID=1389922 RepID=UPI002FE04876